MHSDQAASSDDPLPITVFFSPHRKTTEKATSQQLSDKVFTRKVLRESVRHLLYNPEKNSKQAQLLCNLFFGVWKKSHIEPNNFTKAAFVKVSSLVAILAR
ncbi:hypothetical protein H6F92_25130 [Microcystis wesenbergii FACHB-1317]|uniref:hypothetical protein n=1 Tax=Microcystis TaxID=1125 RepID=UPI001681543C|nr:MULTISPECIES: hypothetical protein [Microcystis]MBD2291873.1 hypothetical protein [Microcystis wesenbergii FACHB-1317]NCQ93493.1 hypothetical protein [Microcystis aeruginosa LG13-13]NCR64822.1 hypothetical protein [Microcystis aeruginosa LG11-05]UZO78630.1 hypothetical protein M8120_12575 [Microcystis aeruginosa str. Chao 1910]